MSILDAADDLAKACCGIGDFSGDEGHKLGTYLVEVIAPALNRYLVKREEFAGWYLQSAEQTLSELRQLDRGEPIDPSRN